MTVTCTDIEERLARGERPESAVETAHVDACELCRELLADDASVGRLLTAEAPAPRVDVDALRAGINAQVDAERGLVARLRALRSGARVLLAVFAAAAVTLGTLLAAPRADLAVYPPLRMALAVGTLTLVLLAVIQVSLRPLHRPPLSVGLVAALGGLAALLPWLLALLPAAHAAHPAALQGSGAEFVRWAFACMTIGILLGAPLLLLLRGLDRGGHSNRSRALLAATVAGLLGNLALQLHCPVTAPAHLLAGHASVVVVFLLAYAGLRSIRR